MAQIPRGKEWQYEPKWDGFRCLVFRDNSKVELRSRSGQSLTRYFPEIVTAVGALNSTRFVLDGELVVPVGRSLSFDALLQRLHPAASRVLKLSVTSPAWLVVFDLLADSRDTLENLTLQIRRPRLEQFALQFPNDGPIRLSPATENLTEAKKWYGAVGATLDGLIAKRRDLAYASGTRRGMVKIKPVRTADCVVGGFRYLAKKSLVGSLLLGLYDEDGLLNHVGFCSGIKDKDRRALTKKLEALIEEPGFTGKAPGGPSRWSSDRSQEWKPLRPGLVVEVSFDQVMSGRFRHGTGLLRWRSEKSPMQCRMEQLAQKVSRALQLIAGKKKSGGKV